MNVLPLAITRDNQRYEFPIIPAPSALGLTAPWNVKAHGLTEEDVCFVVLLPTVSQAVPGGYRDYVDYEADPVGVAIPTGADLWYVRIVDGAL